MKSIQDTLQVGVANSSAIALNLTQCNELLTFVSLSLAIIYTIYKFSRIGKKK
jgi:hypothetical protein